MRFMQGVFLFSLCLLITFGACRRNQPSLVDKNEAPDTELWYAPPDSTEYEYLVHLYWRGVDNDGTAMSFIWTIQDSLVEGELTWDPANRLRDFRTGRITSRTDSVFSFTAFRAVGGVGVKKNRQAFYIASIDDNGVIDPTPAAVEFIATIGQLPRTVFTTHINGVSTPYRHLEVPKDTVGVMQPFAVSYHGLTTNGLVRSYRYYSLTTEVELEGQNVWYEDLTDTLQTLTNTGPDMLPPKVFKFVAQCKDDANAESPVDAGQYREGVCQIVVNYDPDTAINELYNNYTVSDGAGGKIVLQDRLDFTDGIPDTVPYDSWARLDYSGWDDERDEKIACSPVKPDSCIGFQVAYWKESIYNSAASEFSLWQPRDGVHDTDPNDPPSGVNTDSNTFHIGSLEYELFVRAVDEHERPDGTPPSVPLVGNFSPTLDSIAVEDHLGNRINLGVLDTLTWDFWKGAGWPYTCECDTVDKFQNVCEMDFTCQGKLYPNHRGTFKYVKTWNFHIKAWGRDHPKDPPPSNKDPLGSGIKSWRYMIQNSQGQFVTLGKSNPSFFEYRIDGQTQVDVLDDVISWRKTYPSRYTAPPVGDPYGCEVFATLPTWMNDVMTVFLVGKDTRAQSIYEFDQGIFINGVYRIINQFPDASLGRRTDEQVFSFVVRLVRPGPPDVCP